MKNLKDVILAIEKGAYDVEAWDFKGQEPSDCEAFCLDWFADKLLRYQLKQVCFECQSDDTADIKWTIDFTDALNAYWEAKGYTVASAYYVVTLNV